MGSRMAAMRRGAGHQRSQSPGVESAVLVGQGCRGKAPDGVEGQYWRLEARSKGRQPAFGD